MSRSDTKPKVLTQGEIAAALEKPLAFIKDKGVTFSVLVLNPSIDNPDVAGAIVTEKTIQKRGSLGLKVTSDTMKDVVECLERGEYLPVETVEINKEFLRLKEKEERKTISPDEQNRLAELEKQEEDRQKKATEAIEFATRAYEDAIRERLQEQIKNKAYDNKLIVEQEEILQISAADAFDLEIKNARDSFKKNLEDYYKQKGAFELEKANGIIKFEAFNIRDFEPGEKPDLANYIIKQGKLTKVFVPTETEIELKHERYIIKVQEKDGETSITNLNEIEEQLEKNQKLIDELKRKGEPVPQESEAKFCTSQNYVQIGGPNPGVGKVVINNFIPSPSQRVLESNSNPNNKDVRTYDLGDKIPNGANVKFVSEPYTKNTTEGGKSAEAIITEEPDGYTVTFDKTAPDFVNLTISGGEDNNKTFNILAYKGVDGKMDLVSINGVPAERFKDIANQTKQANKQNKEPDDMVFNHHGKDEKDKSNVDLQALDDLTEVLRGNGGFRDNMIFNNFVLDDKGINVITGKDENDKPTTEQFKNATNDEERQKNNDLGRIVSERLDYVLPVDVQPLSFYEANEFAKRYDGKGAENQFSVIGNMNDDPPCFIEAGSFSSFVNSDGHLQRKMNCLEGKKIPVYPTKAKPEYAKVEYGTIEGRDGMIFDCSIRVPENGKDKDGKDNLMDVSIFKMMGDPTLTTEQREANRKYVEQYFKTSYPRTTLSFESNDMMIKKGAICHKDGREYTMSELKEYYQKLQKPDKSKSQNASREAGQPSPTPQPATTPQLAPLQQAQPLSSQNGSPSPGSPPQQQSFVVAGGRNLPQPNPQIASYDDNANQTRFYYNGAPGAPDVVNQVIVSLPPQPRVGLTATENELLQELIKEQNKLVEEFDKLKKSSATPNQKIDKYYVLADPIKQKVITYAERITEERVESLEKEKYEKDLTEFNNKKARAEALKKQIQEMEKKTLEYNFPGVSASASKSVSITEPKAKEPSKVEIEISEPVKPKETKLDFKEVIKTTRYEIETDKPKITSDKYNLQLKKVEPNIKSIAIETGDPTKQFKVVPQVQLKPPPPPKKVPNTVVDFSSVKKDGRSIIAQVASRVEFSQEKKVTKERLKEITKTGVNPLTFAFNGGDDKDKNAKELAILARNYQAKSQVARKNSEQGSTLYLQLAEEKFGMKPPHKLGGGVYDNITRLLAFGIAQKSVDCAYDYVEYKDTNNDYKEVNRDVWAVSNENGQYPQNIRDAVALIVEEELNLPPTHQSNINNRKYGSSEELNAYNQKVQETKTALKDIIANKGNVRSNMWEKKENFIAIQGKNSGTFKTRDAASKANLTESRDATNSKNLAQEQAINTQLREGKITLDDVKRNYDIDTTEYIVVDNTGNAFGKYDTEKSALKAAEEETQNSAQKSIKVTFTVDTDEGAPAQQEQKFSFRDGESEAKIRATNEITKRYSTYTIKEGDQEIKKGISNESKAEAEDVIKQLNKLDKCIKENGNLMNVGLEINIAGRKEEVSAKEINDEGAAVIDKLKNGEYGDALNSASKVDEKINLVKDALQDQLLVKKGVKKRINGVEVLLDDDEEEKFKDVVVDNYITPDQKQAMIQDKREYEIIVEGKNIEFGTDKDAFDGAKEELKNMPKKLELGKEKVELDLSSLPDVTTVDEIKKKVEEMKNQTANWPNREIKKVLVDGDEQNHPALGTYITPNEKENKEKEIAAEINGKEARPIRDAFVAAASNTTAGKITSSGASSRTAASESTPNPLPEPRKSEEKEETNKTKESPIDSANEFRNAALSLLARATVEVAAAASSNPNNPDILDSLDKVTQNLAKMNQGNSEIAKNSTQSPRLTKEEGYTK